MCNTLMLEQMQLQEEASKKGSEIESQLGLRRDGKLFRLSVILLNLRKIAIYVICKHLNNCALYL